jgi:hypothetical protein
LTVADLDADGRDDVAVTTNTALKYWLTCGGGCPANHDGETWSPSANVLASFTGECPYDGKANCLAAGGNYSASGACSTPQAACTGAGGTWSAATQICTGTTPSAACYENSGVASGRSTRGWVAPNMVATANVAGDSGVDVLFASDSSTLHDGVGYVGVYAALKC